MVKYRETLRLTAMGISQRNVAFSVGCATSTAQDVLRAAKAVVLGWPPPEEMDDTATRSGIYPARDRSDSTKAEIDHAWVDREMRRLGVTMTLLWNECADVLRPMRNGPLLPIFTVQAHQWMLARRANVLRPLLSRRSTNKEELHILSANAVCPDMCV